MDLNHLHLHVKDLARSQNFYQTYLGFKEDRRCDEILFLRNKEGFDLALLQDWKPEPLPSWFHFGFGLTSADEVRQLYSRLRAEGIRIDKPLYEEKDLVSFRCLDPDGYRIEFYWE